MYNTNKEKTFFFWNEEWRKILSGAGTTNVQTLDPADIPTAGQDLHYVGASVSLRPRNSLYRTCRRPPHTRSTELTPLGLVPGATPGTAGGFAVDASGLPIIPASLFDPNGVLYLNSGILPKPTTSNGYAISNVANPIDVRDDIVRIDHKFNDKWAILGHYMHDSVTQGYAQPMLGWLWASYNTVTSTLSNPSNSAAIKLSGTITPNLLVEASINYDGNVINITNSSNSFTPSGWSQAPITSSFAINKNSLPGVMGFGNPYGTAEDTGSAPWHNAAQDYEPKADISYTEGKHAMKFGFSYNRYTKNQQIFGDQQGNFGFSSPDQRQRHGHALGPGRQLLSVPGNANSPLRKPDTFGLRDGQLARDSALELATRPPLRRAAARMGAQQPGRKLQPRSLSAERDSNLERRQHHQHRAVPSFQTSMA